MQPKHNSSADDTDYAAADGSERAGLLSGDSSGGGGDDFFLRGPAGDAVSGGDRLSSVRAQVAEVTGAMRQNVEKMMERGAGLDQLQEQSEQLAGSSDEFYVTSRQIQRRLYLRDLKMKLALAAVILVLMLIIILPIILKK